MDATAIERIQQQSAVMAAQCVLDSKADFPAIIVPAGYHIRSLEESNQYKDRFRGRYSTFSKDDFGRYAVANTAQAVFVNGETFEAFAVFDLGTKAKPGHCQHLAVLKLEETAAYAAMLNLCVIGTFKQRDMAEYIEDWADYFHATDHNDAPMPLADAIMAIRNVTVESQRHQNSQMQALSESRSLMESVTASSEHTLPANLHFDCARHIGGLSDDYRIRLRVAPKDKEIFFKARPANFDTISEKVAEEFGASVGALLTGVCPVYLGKFSF